MDFVNEVADWIVGIGFGRKTNGEISIGESRSGKKYHSIEFSYQTMFGGEIQIYSRNFILVKYTFRGAKDSFTANSPEDFHTNMVERFGVFIVEY
jgi:hypothetical protein